MTTTETLQSMVGALDERAVTLSYLEKYLAGTQPLAYLSKEAREATKLGRMSSNIPRLAVNSLAERLRVTGLTVDGADSPDLWAMWRANDLDQSLGTALREALGLGSSFAIVWDPTGTRRPRVSVESPHQVAILRDPGTRETLAAVKRWEADKATYAVLYLPDRIERYRSDQPGAALGFRHVATVPNPLGVVPVVEFRNGDRLLGPGTSEIDDLIPLVDALAKLLADLMVGSEFYSRPRRTATGIQLDTDEDGSPVSPFAEGDRMLISEEDGARFGSLPAADLQSYDAAVKIILGQIMAVSALPAHFLGVTTSNPSSADGNRSAEASLAARAESRQGQFGRPVEQLARLMEAVRTDRGPETISVAVKWADPTTRSIAQEADAVTKLFAAGLLPAEYALRRLGYDDEQIALIRRARRAESVDRLAFAGPTGAPQ